MIKQLIAVACIGGSFLLAIASMVPGKVDCSWQSHQPAAVCAADLNGGLKQ